MREMVYTSRYQEPIRLTDGIYKGFHFYVLSLGSHPTAYIDVTNTKYYGKSVNDLTEIECHWGITYASSRLSTVDHCGWFIGWDYAHFRDFTYSDLFPNNRYNEKKWTTQEIIEECKKVINQLVGDEVCKNCKHFMFSDCYGECKKVYKGIVNPWDTCEHFEKEMVGNLQHGK